jgi:hypothetical protein
MRDVVLIAPSADKSARLAYDPNSGVGRVFMGDDCVAMFERIDPKVKLILTYRGLKPNAVYCREGKGWRVFHQP